MDKRIVVIVSEKTKTEVKKLSEETGETEGRIVAMAMFTLKKLFPDSKGDLIEKVYGGEDAS